MDAEDETSGGNQENAGGVIIQNLNHYILAEYGNDFM